MLQQSKGDDDMNRMKDKVSKYLSFMLIGIVQFYRAVFSSITPGACRFSPTCSCYAIEALKNHGPIRGSWLTVCRIVRCNPFSGNWGFDPVPPSSKSHHSSVGDMHNGAGQKI